MSLIAPIVRIARRIRLQQAETELLFLEARAEQDIQRQRARVARLRDRTGQPPMPITADTLRRMVERNAKAVLLA